VTHLRKIMLEELQRRHYSERERLPSDGFIERAHRHSSKHTPPPCARPIKHLRHPLIHKSLVQSRVCLCTGRATTSHDPSARSGQLRVGRDVQHGLGEVSHLFGCHPKA